MTATTTAHTSPRSSVLDRGTAMRLAATEYDRFAAQLRALDAADWAAPTECPGWDVRAMAGHVLGMAQLAASLRQSVTQNARAARAGGGIDALTDLQVRDHAALSPEDVVERFVTVAPRAVRGRRRLGALIGRMTLPEEQVVGHRTERWRFGYLLDAILTRDTWMHRIDIAHATGRDLELTSDHDGVIVADVVAEWARRHGRACRARLTGPAGGEWASGEAGETLELDAVEFCRILSGRGQGTGLLAEQVPF